MASEFKLRRTVEFHETDMAGIVHFSNYLKYMEGTEIAFLRSLDIPLFEKTGQGFMTWPRVKAECEYLSPLRFGDTVEVNLQVKEIGTKSLKIAFRFIKVEGDVLTPVARGELTNVYACCDESTGEMSAREIPESVRGKLRD